MIRCLIILWIFQKFANARPSTCVLDGIPEFSSRTTYHLQTTINDTYRGELATFPTKNIQRVKIKDNKYFNVTWRNQILTLSTGVNFDKYETETWYTSLPSISVALHFDCTQDHEKDLIFIQKINDTNNHSPELNQQVFKYAFGMTVPKNFVFTDLVPIKAFDDDVSNGQIYFEIPSNDFVKIQHVGIPRSYRLKEFSTKLIALKDIVAPFHRQFKLLVTDGHNPSRQTSSTITIVVTTPEKLRLRESDRIFAKHLYHARYRPKHNLQMQEKLLLSNDASIVLKQRGYENYFNITLRNSEVIVNNVKPLSLDVFKLDFIVIEVEAFDRTLHRLIERTAILVQLPELAGSGNELILFDLFANNYVLFVTLVLIILFVGVRPRPRMSNFLISWFSKKKRY